MENQNFLKTFADTPGPLVAPTSSPDARTVEAPAKQTVPETLKRDSKQFGAFIQSLGEPDKEEMIARLLKGEPTAEDIPQIAEVHNQYLEAKKNAEKMGNEMGEVFIEMKNRSPYLVDLCKEWGEDVIKDLVIKGMGEAAFTDRETFDQLVKFHKERADFGVRETAVNKGLLEYCQKFNLDPDALAKKMKTDGDAGYAAYLKAHFTKDIGWFYRKGKLAAAERLTAEGGRLRRDFQAANSERDALLKDAGDFIGMLVSENDVWRTALARTTIGERPAFVNAVEKQPSLQEAKAMMPTADNFKEKYLRAFIKRQPAAMRNPATMDDATFATFADNFDTYVQEETRKELDSRGGLWAILQKLTLGTVRFIDKPGIKAKLRQPL